MNGLIPEIYLLFYCKFRRHSILGAIKTTEALNILSHSFRCHKLMRHAILKEMESFGLVEHVSNEQIKLLKVPERKLTRVEWIIEMEEARNRKVVWE